MSYLGSTKLFKQILDSEIFEIKNSIISSIEEDETRIKLKKRNIAEITSKELKSHLIAHCKVTGLKSYLGEMSHDTLTLLYEDFEEEKEEKKKNKHFLTKKIRQGIEKDFDNYFIELKDDKLKAFTELTASQLAPKIIEELTLVGIEIFLFSLSALTLKTFCEKLGYEVPGNNPNLMVTSILCGEVPAKKEAPAKKVVTFSKKKLPLKKGLTYQDVFQHYYVEELQQFCRDNDLKISGTKKEVIVRILNYLNHGIVEAAGDKRKKKAVDNAAKETSQEVEEEEEEEEEEPQEDDAQTPVEEEEDDDDDVELKPEEVERSEEVIPEKVSTPIKAKKSTSKIVSPIPKSKKSSK